MPPETLTYEQACTIAGVPLDRGFVTYAEVVDGLRKVIPYVYDDVVASDQIGWIKDIETED